MAKQDNISFSQFITIAVAEKLSALMTLDYIQERGKRGDKYAFNSVLDKIAAADLEPNDADRLDQAIDI